MAQALITIDGTPGSNDDLTIGATVLLSNQDSGGEFSYFWQILDQPPGPADLIIPNDIRDTSFTPRKEGSYLIQLTVNNNTDIVNRAIAAVRFIKTRERAPAAQEQTEVDTAKGWGDATNDWFARLNDSISDPGVVIGVAGSSLSYGDIIGLAALGPSATLKPGLPGEEVVPQFSIVSGDNLNTVPVFVFVGTSSGSSSAIAGDVIKARLFGLLLTSLSYTPVVGSAVYVGASGELVGDFTTVDAPRLVGYVVGEPTAGTYAIYFNGMMSMSATMELLSANTSAIGVAPANTIRLVNDANVLKYSANGSPYTEISGGSGSGSEFDLGVYFLGKPDSEDLILRYTFNQEVTFPIDLVGSHATVEIPSGTIDTELSIIYDDGVSETTIGSINYGPAAINASFSLSSETTFAIGDTIKIVAPTTPDSDISGISINLKGTRA